MPVQPEKPSSRLPQTLEPFERFRREMDRLLDDFTGGLFGRSSFDPMPFRRTEAAFRTMPAVDVAETEKAYEIKAELPGLDEKNIEVRVANGVLSIKGDRRCEPEIQLSVRLKHSPYGIATDHRRADGLRGNKIVHN